jgi:hypothetical protein
MSAFGGKADMTFCSNSLSRSLLGVKRTCPFALHTSANDPKRTSLPSSVRREKAVEGIRRRVKSQVGFHEADYNVPVMARPIALAFAEAIDQPTGERRVTGVTR